MLPAWTFPDGSSQAGAFERLLTAASGVSGVTHAAVATRMPLAGAGAGSDLVRADQPFDEKTDQQVRIRLVSPGYFATLGIPIVAGRDIELRDRRAAQPVVVVNQTLAQRLAGGRPLVGSPVKFALREFNGEGRTTRWEVVGIAGDTFDEGPRRAVAPEVFVPLAQAPVDVLGWMGGQALLAVSGPGDVRQLAPQLRLAVGGAGLRIPLYDIRTLDDRLATQFGSERVASRVVTFLAGAGVLLSGLGMFAVISYLVRTRRREIAVRMALGATPAQMSRSVIGEGLWMSVFGLGLGLAGCFGLTHTFRALLFGVTSTDPLTMSGVGLLLAVLTLAATWLPARSVASLDPAIVLRQD